MAKKTLFHGTTYENYLSIMENGFNPNNKTWDCSDDRSIYFYDMTKDADEILEYDGVEMLRESLIRKAFENAQITAGISGSNSDKLVVFEVEIEEENIEDDTSCENMESSASCVDIDYIELDMIVNTYVSDNAYNPHLRFFYIAGLIENDYLNTCGLNQLETTAIETIASAGIYIDELLEFDWEEK